MGVIIQATDCILCRGAGCVTCGNSGVVRVLDAPIPSAVADLFTPGDGAKVTALSEHRCTLRLGNLELRFVVDDELGWVFDEIVGRAMIHVEQMSVSHYWMGLTSLPGDPEFDIHVNIGSTSGRARVHMTGWSDA